MRIVMYDGHHPLMLTEHQHWIRHCVYLILHDCIGINLLICLCYMWINITFGMHKTIDSICCLGGHKAHMRLTFAHLPLPLAPLTAHPQREKVILRYVTHTYIYIYMLVTQAWLGINPELLCIVRSQSLGICMFRLCR